MSEQTEKPMPPPPTRESPVTLRELSAETVVAVCDLNVKPEQDNFVAPNSFSIAQAYYSKTAWFRGVYAGETPVGFAMMALEDGKVPYLWRFMIDAKYQHLGFGSQALQRLIEHAKAQPGAKAMELSAVPAEGGPRPFYEKHGFEFTGKVEHGEEVFRLEF